jgi:hypothetical protein
LRGGNRVGVVLADEFNELILYVEEHAVGIAEVFFEDHGKFQEGLEVVCHLLGDLPLCAKDRGEGIVDEGHDGLAKPSPRAEAGTAVHFPGGCAVPPGNVVKSVEIDAAGPLVEVSHGRSHLVRGVVVFIGLARAQQY